nr:MAG TPA: hypothetical protein [Caudoviricetes sp.]
MPPSCHRSQRFHRWVLFYVPPNKKKPPIFAL